MQKADDFPTMRPVRATSHPPAAFPAGARLVRSVLEVSGMALLAFLTAALAWLVIAREPGVRIDSAGVSRLNPSVATHTPPDADRARAMQLLTTESVFQRGLSAPVDTSADAPETQLSLVITGLRAADPGSAIIRLPNNREARFNEGDEILDGVVLLDVFEDSVLLSRNGVREKLIWDRPRAFLSERKSGEAIPAAAGTPSVAAAPVDTRAALSTLMDQIALVPDATYGEFRGYRINARGDGALPTALLEEGDILTSVNGVELGETLNIQAIEAALGGASQIEFFILREGDEKRVSIPVASLTGN